MDSEGKLVITSEEDDDGQGSVKKGKPVCYLAGIANSGGKFCG